MGGHEEFLRHFVREIIKFRLKPRVKILALPARAIFGLPLRSNGPIHTRQKEIQADLLAGAGCMLRAVILLSGQEVPHPLSR